MSIITMKRTWASKYLSFCMMGVIVILLVESAGASRAKLVDNGYEGVVVAISQEIDESLGPPIIQSIKQIIDEASRRLYRATRKRAYFRNVKILVPKSWENTPVNRTALGENYEDSEVRIDYMNNVYQNQPYTHQPGGCGVPGSYIHLTPDYLTDNTQAAWWGPRGKAFLLEWAKLRWGVFDELGYPGDDSFPLFYILDDRLNGGLFGGGTIHPTYCADKPVEGRQIDKRGRSGCGLNDQGEPDKDCRFLPYKDQLATSSLMSYPFIFGDRVVEFCDDEHSDHPHNAVAPTKQNLFCGGRSVWDIMNQHEDFANNANFPTERYEDPVVELVQHADANYALVLDYSGSMNDHYRVHKLRKTARRWLLHEVADGSYVAIIKFSKSAQLVHPLKRIEDEASRKALADSLGTSADGGTSIGAGLYVAVKKILVGATNPVILLITDGEENENPRIEHIMPNVLKSGVRVVTVAFGAEADPKLERVAQMTGGKTFTVNDIDEGQMLEDAFEGALTYQPPPPKFNTSVILHENTYKGPQRETGGHFNIDFTIGRNLVLRLDTNDHSHITQPPHLIRPGGSLIGGAQFDPNTYSWSILVPLAEEGEWRWMVGISGNNENFIRVKVTSQTRSPDIEPITTKAWVSSGATDVDARSQRVIIYAEVKQGKNPVINANVSALVTPPRESDPPQLYYLLDNGQGADVQSGDGIYSRYMTKFYGTGRYSVKAQVTDGGQAVINKGFHTEPLNRMKRSQPNIYEVNERPPYCCGSVVPIDLDNAPVTGTFSRVAMAGSLKVAEAEPKVEGVFKDVFPPGEIRDFRVLETDPSENNLKLQNITFKWTATGDDLDAGMASDYILRMSTNQSQLTQWNFDDASADTLIHLNTTEVNLNVPSGEKIQFTKLVEIDLNSENSYYFALKAVDESGLKSPVSNVAAIGGTIHFQETPYATITFSSPSDTGVYYPDIEEETNYPASGFASYTPNFNDEIHPSTSDESFGSDDPVTTYQEYDITENEIFDDEVRKIDIDIDINGTLSPPEWEVELSPTNGTPVFIELAHSTDPENADFELTDDYSLAIPIWAIVIVIVFIVMIIALTVLVLSKRKYGKYDCVET